MHYKLYINSKYSWISRGWWGQFGCLHFHRQSWNRWRRSLQSARRAFWSQASSGTEELEVGHYKVKCYYANFIQSPCQWLNPNGENHKHWRRWRVQKSVRSYCTFGGSSTAINCDDYQSSLWNQARNCDKAGIRKSVVDTNTFGVSRRCRHDPRELRSERLPKRRVRRE